MNIGLVLELVMLRNLLSLFFTFLREKMLEKELFLNYNIVSLQKNKIMKSFVNVKLKRDTVKGMISTYEFLVWSNTGEDKKDCQKILKALKTAIQDENNN